MKKILIILTAVVLIFASCNKGAKTSQQIKDDIYSYKEKIANLEKQLSEVKDTTKSKVAVKVK